MIDIEKMQQDFLAKKKALENMPIEEKNRNANSHVFGVVDDRYGCVVCDATVNSFWKYSCN